MHPLPRELNRLQLAIQRLVDADLLLEDDAAPLLAESDAARRSFEAGNMPAARHHIERLAGRAEGLVEAGALAPADGQGLIRTARHVATGHTG
jgi:hypothetical protein